MSTKKRMTASTENYSALIKSLESRIARAGAIIVGAGSGLSAAAGLTYAGDRFERAFADFIAQYHFTDMYSAGFHPFVSPEEKWAYWSRHIDINRYAQDGGSVYGNLLRLLEGKECFVLTTNVDHCFQRAGFDKERLFYTQGDYGLWQCPEPCHKKNYDNGEVVHQMVMGQRDMRVPPELVPHCPLCGREMVMNLRCDETFVEDEGWHLAASRYVHFLHSQNKQNVLYLELGVGGNTPAIIKYPFWRMTYENENASYACINRGEAFVPNEIANRSMCVDADIGEVLHDIIK